MLRAGWMIGELLADHVQPSSVAQITAEVIDHVYDYPGVIAENIAPYAARFGLPRGDGVALLDHLLSLAEYRDRDEMVAMARKNERDGYATPRALRRALTDILRGLAGERGLHLGDLQRQFAYDRLLCRVFIVDPGVWVLKAAVAMLARMRGVARHTWDVDISRRVGDLKETEAAFREAAARDLHDHFL